MQTKKRTSLGIIKRITKEVIVIVSGVSVLLFISLGLGTFADNVVQEAEQAKNDILQKTAEIQSLQTKIAQFGNALPIWTSIRDKQGKYKLNLSRDEATNIFMELRDQYAFKNIRLTVAPIRPSSDTTLIKTKMRVMESDINISMRAYSDEQVVQFLEDVKQRLAGVVKVKNFRMSRAVNLLANTPNFNADPLTALNEPQLDVVINLVWYGIEEISPANPAQPGATP